MTCYAGRRIIYDLVLGDPNLQPSVRPVLTA